MINKKQKLGTYIMKALAIALTIALILPTYTGIVSEAAKTPKLTITKTTNIYVGKKLNINVNNKIKGAKYNWTTSNQKIATVNNKGVVTGIKAGTATITCKVTAPKKEYTLTGVVNIVKGAQSITISNKAKAKTLILGDNIKLKTKIKPTKVTDAITWKSNNTSVVKVNKKGKLTALTTGKAKITAKTKSGKKASLTVNVTDTITVATQKELKEALARTNLSEIKIETDKALLFTIPEGSNLNNTVLVVNAPNADVVNQGTVFKTIRIDAIKATTFTEKGKGNNFDLRAPNARLVVAEGAEVSNITLGGAKVEIVVDGTITGAVTCSESATTAPEITISGKTTVEVTIVINKEGAKLVTNIKVTVQLNANAELTFEAGAKGSTIEKKNDSIKETITNNSGSEIDVTVEGTTPDTDTDTPSTGGTVTPPPSPSTKTETVTGVSSNDGKTATYTLPKNIDQLSSAKVKVEGTVDKDYTISNVVLKYVTGLLDKESQYISLWKTTNTFSTTQDGLTVSFTGTGSTKTVTFDNVNYEVEVVEASNTVKVKKDGGVSTFELSKTGKNKLTITSDLNDNVASLVTFEVTY